MILQRDWSVYSNILKLIQGNFLDLILSFPQGNKTLKVIIQSRKHWEVKSVTGLVSEHSAKLTSKHHNSAGFQ